jgi:hypothetical protein
MLIKVLCSNDTYDMIKSTRLDEFIASGKITKFYRSSGWVTVGIDQTRKTNHGNRVNERRNATQ